MRAKKLGNLWSSGQAEDGLGQLNAWETGWALQLTDQRDQTIQELQDQLAVSHSKVSVATALFLPLYRRKAGVWGVETLV